MNLWTKYCSVTIQMETLCPGADLGGGCRGCAPPPPEITCSFLIQLVFCEKKKNCFIGVEVKSKRLVHPLLKEILDPPLLPVCHKVLSLSVQRKSGPIAQAG